MNDQERVARLTDQTANALVAARSALRSAAISATEFDRMLERRLDDVSELPGAAERAFQAEQAGRGSLTEAGVEDATNQVRSGLYKAQLSADVLNGRVGAGLSELETINDELGRGARAIEAGKSFLDELEQIPDQRTPQTEELRKRLVVMDRAAAAAALGMRSAESRLQDARQTTKSLIERPSSVDLSGRTSAAIDGTAADLRRQLSGARGQLADSGEQLRTSQPDADRATQESIDLANAMRAAVNPTPASASRTQTASAEQGGRRRAAEQAQDTFRDR